MLRLPLWSRLIHAADEPGVQLDLGRAFRATVAFMVPLLLAAGGWLPLDVSFVALTAQNIALVDVRGDYRLRFALVVVIAAVFVGATALGATVSGHVGAAVAAMALMAIAGGAFRHLSTDYGPSLAIGSTLVFLLAAAEAPTAANIKSHALAAFVGGLWGIVLQIAAWPLRAQHPLRRTVADSWVVVGELFQALAPNPGASEATRHERVLVAETDVRTALDKTYAALAAARPGPLRRQLEALNLAGARLATRIVALNTALETLVAAEEFPRLAPAVEPALISLHNLARSVAIAVVSRQPAHLATFDVRLRRVASLLRVLDARLQSSPATKAAGAPLAEILRQLERLLPEIQAALRATIDRANERAAFSLELLDLREHALKPLASALNLSPHIDPALARHTLRLALLTMLGVIAFKHLGLPHGYWLPFTVVVVLQPDYGSTRQRAGQRVLGTLAGSAAASVLLWLHLPFAALMVAAAATMFAFAYLVKRNYALAIFYVTLFLVLLTEAAGPVTWAFTAERLGSTLVGGGLALLAAHAFWPVWERDRFPPILAATYQANRDYLALLLERLRQNGAFDAVAIRAKRQAERATNAAFSSLRRMNGDPANQREGLERVAALVNGNQRITRALNVLAVHLPPPPGTKTPVLARFESLATAAFALLDRSARGDSPAPAEFAPVLEALEREPIAEAAAAEAAGVFGPLATVATELAALLVAVQDTAPAREGDVMQD